MRANWVRKITAGVGAVLLLIAGTSCSTTVNKQEENEKPVQNSLQRSAVALFTPSDSFTLSENTPINTWRALESTFTKQLTVAGFEKENISTATSSTLSEQSQSIQDFVVEHSTGQLESKNSQASSSVKGSENDSDTSIDHLTLVIAPVVRDASLLTQYYGDYLSLEGKNAESIEQSSATEDAVNNEDDENKLALERMDSALALAKQQGMHIILLGNTVKNVKADVLVSCVNAYSIGQLQAQQIAAKLELSQAKATDPKAVEIFVPWYPQTDSLKDETAQQQAQREYAEGTMSAIFSRQFFEGAWSVLQPYFAQGQAKSVSGKLQSSSTVDDWFEVVFDASSAKKIDTEIDNRFDSSPELPRVQAILAGNDDVAMHVITHLQSLGYNGSSADVNPYITVSDIIDGFTGSKDIEKKPVPSPAQKAPLSQTEQESQETKKDATSYWPIITGYGAYRSAMPGIVNGAQWITGLESRESIAQSLVTLVQMVSNGKKMQDAAIVSKADKQHTYNTVTTRLWAISAGNLKSMLIDNGYISLADAGM